MFGMFAGIYHWFPKMFGRYLNSTLGYIHFWVTMIGAYLIFWPCTMKGWLVCHAVTWIRAAGSPSTSLAI
jgi:heme/copper-type cytochrome/quinol oxidase subunit 1